MLVVPVLSLLLVVVGHVELISVEPRFCPDPMTQDQVYKEVISTPAPESLKNVYKNDFKKERINIMPGVYFYIGYALSNVIVIDAPDGFILIDTLDSATALIPVLNDVQQNINSTKKFKAIMYTHHHPDHIGGAIALTARQPVDPVEVWAYKDLAKEFYDKWQFNQALFITRGSRQVGIDLPDGAFLTTGIGPRFVLDQTTGLLLVPPTHFLSSEQADVNIAGVDMTLMHLPGETDDHMGIYVPSLKMFMIGDDMYRAFPNLYAIRGTPPRPVLEWSKSCNKVSKLDIEYFLPCHTEPIIGKANIQQQLHIYADAIKYVHDQTTRLMNRGLHPDVIAQQIELPNAIRNNPYLLEHYGVVEWGSKGVFEGRVGWFSGLPEELFPLTPQDQAESLVKLLNFKKAMKKVKTSISKGTEKDLRWALKLTSIFWHARKSMGKAITIQEVLSLRSSAIRNLAALQTSGNARNYLLRWVLEENCNLTNKAPSFTQVGAITLLPVRNLVTKMAMMLMAENLDNVASTTVLHFTDENLTFSLSIRNNVLNVEEQDTAGADVRIDMDLIGFRNVLMRRNTLEEVGASVTPSFEAGNEFMSYFDDPTIFYF